ncbi:MAG: GTPase RsgA [Burkholderiaceae bacterium]
MPDFLDLRALRDIGLTHDIVQAALHAPRPAGARLARVVALHRDHLVAHDGVRAHELVAWPTLRLALEMDGERLVVGDWLWCAPGEAAPDDEPERNARLAVARDGRSPGAGQRGWALARLPPRNLLTRRDPAGGRQALVANVDTALVVMGLDGDFNLRRLDRFLVLVRSARARPVVVLSKADICGDPAAAVARVLAHLGAPARAAVGASASASAPPRDGAGPANTGADAHAPAVVALDARTPGAARILAPGSRAARRS